MLGNELREAFIRYFVSKDHKVVSSSSLVPQDDPTLLFTNAGMVQFKDVFTGIEKRDYSRAVTVQKCVRAGGKHNDLDTVGRTARHHTFFEMMGNFSFGDYFKEDAIHYAWEFLTEIIKLPKDKLWATVFLDDDEAEQLWALKTEIPANRIVRLGEKDNFWTMGDVGPCGPCSEVIYDRGEAYCCDAEVCAIGECDCDRWLEIWNLVFMQFEKDVDGKLTPLPQPSVDTGMGLERLASILQEVDSNFETDLMKPLIGWLEKNTGIAYSSFESGFPMRVIADHARACTFLIADGVLPSNEGKGYVLRRILRRAVRFGKMLSLEKPFLFKMVDVVVGLMKDAYPEVIEQQDNIKKIIKIEEERFHKTLHEGMKVANSIVDQTKKAGKSYIEGKDAFLLYDTFGFPLDLTKDLAEENNLMLDEKGFVAEMEIQRNRARLARGEVGKMEFTAAFINALGGIPKSQFVGYDKTSSDTKILSLLINDQAVESAKAGEEVFVVLQETPFYPESGGQIGDQGVITTKQGVLEVYDVKKLPDGKIIHLGKVTKGEIKTTDMVNVKVESIRRLDTARNHTATHLLHQALKQVLGEHVNQAGSLITPQRLRFDFTHFERLTEEKIRDIENIVNKQILDGIPISSYETSFEQAKTIGAIALFGEKYDDIVRIIQIGDYSMELCGGTHVNNTAEVGVFKIVSEGGIGSGLRRIEAISGTEALLYLNSMEEVVKNASKILKSNPESIITRIDQLLLDNKEKNKELERFVTRLANQQSVDLLEQCKEVEGVKFLALKAEVGTMDELRSMGDAFKNKLKSGVIVLGAAIDKKANFVVMASDDVLKKGVHAGKLIKKIAKVADGGGGGRSNMAQAGGKDITKISHALELSEGFLKEQLD